MNVDYDPEFDYIAQATLYAEIAALEAKNGFWRATCAELRAECDTFQAEANRLQTEKQELAARWETRYNEKPGDLDAMRAQLAAASRDLAAARMQAAKAEADLRSQTNHRGRLIEAAGALLEYLATTNGDEIRAGGPLHQHVTAVWEQMPSPWRAPSPISYTPTDNGNAHELLTRPGTTISEQPPGNGTIVSAQPVAIVLPPAGNEPEPDLPDGYKKVRGNSVVRDGDLVYHAGKWQPPTRIAINKSRASQYQMVARPHVDAQAEEQPAS